MPQCNEEVVFGSILLFFRQNVREQMVGGLSWLSLLN